MLVRFLKPFQAFNEGEFAGLPDDQAAKLVANGTAALATADQAAPSQPALRVGVWTLVRMTATVVSGQGAPDYAVGQLVVMPPGMAGTFLAGVAVKVREYQDFLATGLARPQPIGQLSVFFTNSQTNVRFTAEYGPYLPNTVAGFGISTSFDLVKAGVAVWADGSGGAYGSEVNSITALVGARPYVG